MDIIADWFFFVILSFVIAFAVARAIKEGRGE